MLSTLLFFTSLSLASSAEVHQNAEYVKSAMTLIQSAVDEMPSSARQLAINALVKTVAEAPTFSADQLALLVDLQNYLDDVLALLAAAKAADDILLAQVTTAVDSCNSAGEANDAALTATVAGHKSDHQTCRDEELPLHTAEDTACAALVAFMSTTVSQNTFCSFPEVVRAQMPNWIIQIGLGQSHYTSRETSYISHSTACTTTRSTHEAKKTICDGHQTTYETTLCSHRATRIVQCNTRDTCHAGALAAHAATTATITTAADGRVNTAAAVIHVKCLVQRLQDGLSLEIPNAGCPFPDVNDATHQATYNQVWVADPAKDPCTLDHVTPHPGHTTFDDTNYAANVHILIIDTGNDCPHDDL